MRIDFCTPEVMSYTPEVKLYSDNTPFVLSNQIPIVNNAESIIINVFDQQELQAALMLTDLLRQESPRALFTLYIPYFPGARQDRINLSGDITFGAKYYARLINSYNFDKVVVADPHSDVVAALVNNCVVLPINGILAHGLGYELMTSLIDHYDGIIAPDGGAGKRAYEVGHFFNVPVKQAWKHRNVANGSLEGFGIEPIEPGKYLIVDDICDGGGTFTGLDSILPEGVSCDLYVTHGIFSNGIRDLVAHFDNIYTTNSIGQYHTHPNLRVLDIREAVLNDWI